MDASIRGETHGSEITEGDLVEMNMIRSGCQNCISQEVCVLISCIRRGDVRRHDIGRQSENGGLIVSSATLRHAGSEAMNFVSLILQDQSQSERTVHFPLMTYSDNLIGY